MINSSTRKLIRFYFIYLTLFFILTAGTSHRVKLGTILLNQFPAWTFDFRSGVDASGNQSLLFPIDDKME